MKEKMIINEIYPSFVMYSITKEEEGWMGKNIFALIYKNKAMLLDAGYEDECMRVKKDLLSKGIAIVSVIPTHFHPDHVKGINILDKPAVYGNSSAAGTLRFFYDEEAAERMMPGIIITDDTVIDFGSFRLSFAHAPGHSDCSMLININDEFLHIGDLYIRSDDGKDVLPYVKWDNIRDHLASFDIIEDNLDKRILISHGLCPVARDEMTGGLEDRRKYLKALLDSDNTVSAEDALKGCSREFIRLNWRKDV